MNFRLFIDRLLKEGLLRRVDNLVDWKYELGEIARRSELPLLFVNVKDYPGLRVFTNGLASLSSMALALGFQKEEGWKEILRKVSLGAGVPIEPVILETGPVSENIVTGQDVNLFRFPVPHWSKYDAGRYIGTWHANVTRDPETGSRNLGVYRMQILSQNQTTVSTSGNSHLSHHFAKAEKKGQPLEMAVVIGAAEPLVMAAAAGYPRGSDEYELAGGLQGAAVRLIRCRTVNLEVPAEAEIVIEGLLKPGVRVQDGPYFDYAGKPTTNENAYLFEVTSIMFRNNPIFRGAAVGHPGAEDQQLFSLLAGLNLFDLHDSRARHQFQSRLARGRFFRAFQFVGSHTVPALFRNTIKRLSTGS